jgi:SepF-like predicted cell division protein (DUF552 family)
VKGQRKRTDEEKQRVAIERRVKRMTTTLGGKMARVGKEKVVAIVTPPKRKRETKITMIYMNKPKKWLNSDDMFWARLVGLEGLMKIH